MSIKLIRIFWTEPGMKLHLFVNALVLWVIIIGGNGFQQVSLIFKELHYGQAYTVYVLDLTGHPQTQFLLSPTH